MAAPLSRAVFPGYALVAHDADAIRRTFLGVFGVLALASVPAGLGISAIAGPIVGVLLGDAWESAIPIIELVAISGVLVALASNASYVCLAAGRPRRITALIALNCGPALVRARVPGSREGCDRRRMGDLLRCCRDDACDPRHVGQRCGCQDGRPGARDRATGDCRTIHVRGRQAGIRLRWGSRCRRPARIGCSGSALLRGSAHGDCGARRAVRRARRAPSSLALALRFPKCRTTGHRAHEHASVLRAHPSPAPTVTWSSQTCASWSRS